MEFKATGRDANGGYAEYMTVPENFAYAIPETFSDVQAAPLLCAGAIGYRSLNLTGIKDGETLGLTGFGASAHPVLKMVRYRYPASRVFVFARNKRTGICQISWRCGPAPQKKRHRNRSTPLSTPHLPAWKPVVEAMKNLDRGGRLVINAIRKESTDQKLSSSSTTPTTSG
ncbi:MAG: hypothetical protein R2875_01340 [Desulfobacterales bacterium]